MIGRLASALACAAALASIAHADPSKAVLAALAPASDVRRAVAIGPAGQLYEPDGHGAWTRHRAGSVADDLVAATQAGAIVIAGAKSGPPYKLTADAWTAIDLGPHAKAIVGAGTRAVAAVGRSVFALDHQAPTKLPDAPAPVLALAAGSAGVVAQTDGGVDRLDGHGWKPIQGAPHGIVALVSERWALVEHGAFDLRSLKTVAWPTGSHVAVATTIGAALVAVAATGKAIELVSLRADKLDREAIPLDPPAVVVGVVADAAGRVVVATRDGRLALRDHGKWTIATVRDELPQPRPGPPPATSRE